MSGTQGQSLRLEGIKIKLVNQKDIMPKDAIPNFNSSAIELCIKNINDLSEYFLYGNDDNFFADYVTPEFFFIKKKNNASCCTFLIPINNFLCFQSPKIQKVIRFLPRRIRDKVQQLFLFRI